MQYSLVNGQKVTPFPKAKGSCTVCGADTLSKCGEKVMWHWAHKSKLECDPWWENETEWHRRWKENFPESFREIVHNCENTGEKHRADIKSEKGIVLEIQNSPISLEELRSREHFYQNLVWIVNGTKFQSRFKVFNTYLPDPNRPEFDDIVFQPAPNENSCTSFWRKSENPNALTNQRELVRVHSIRHIKGMMDRHYIGHHPMFWQRAHAAWLEAKCPVLIDFGTDILWQLVKYKGRFPTVRAIGKHRVIYDIINETAVENIGRNYSIVTDERMQSGVDAQ